MTLGHHCRVYSQLPPLFSAFRSMMFRSRPVRSLMLSSHRFLSLPLRLPPWTVPCTIVLASPDDRVSCPYHFSLRLFTEVRSSCGPMAFQFWLSLPHWLCNICRRYRGVCGNIKSPMPVSFFKCMKYIPLKKTGRFWKRRIRIGIGLLL